MVDEVSVMRAVKEEQEPDKDRSADESDGDLPGDHLAADQIDSAEQEKHRGHRADRFGRVSKENVKRGLLGNIARHNHVKWGIRFQLAHPIPIGNNAQVKLRKRRDVRRHHTREDKEWQKRAGNGIDDSSEESAESHRYKYHDRDHKIVDSRGHKERDRHSKQCRRRNFCSLAEYYRVNDLNECSA